MKERNSSSILFEIDQFFDLITCNEIDSYKVRNTLAKPEK